MYLDDPLFPKPDDKDTKIWRYMDIAKFLSLIDNKALFFSRADFLGDPFEGSIPSAKGQINLNDYARQQAGEVLDPEHPVEPLPYSIHDLFRKTSYVCCFNMNSFESAALWSRHTKAGHGVAIQSTFARLCDCFHDCRDETIKISLTNYIDHDNQTIDVLKNAYLPIIHKRKCFEDEKELRAFITFPHQIFPHGGPLYKEILDQFPRGFFVTADLDILIERIYIAPSSPPWIKGLLTSILKKYEVKKEILPSTMDQNPII